MMRLSFIWSTSFLVAAGIGFGTGWLAYLHLPFSPRIALPCEPWPLRMAFSKDCRLVAVSHEDGREKRHWKGALRIWDTQKGTLLFSIPHFEAGAGLPGGRSFPARRDHGLAFTPEEDMLVTFDGAEAKCHKIPSGEPWQPTINRRFPVDKKREVESDLIYDAQGSLFVLVRDWPNGNISVCDLWSGRQIFSSNRRHAWFFTAFLMDGEGLKTQLRNISNGKVCREFTRPDGKDGFDALTCTPDGRTIVHINGKIRVWRDDEETLYDLAAHQEPAISPDGRLLATRVFRPDTYPEWLMPLLSRIGVGVNSPALVIYDLSTAQEIACMPHADLAHFSGDGKSLAVTTENALELYDLPLRKPWGKIVGMALASALAIFFCGHWIRWRSKRSG